LSKSSKVLYDKFQIPSTKFQTKSKIQISHEVTTESSPGRQSRDKIDFIQVSHEVTIESSPGRQSRDKKDFDSNESRSDD
jgi:hypothetical protein